MYFEINVSFNGAHFFATAPRSIQDEGKLLKVYKELSDKFPTADGWALSVSCEPEVRYPVRVNVEEWKVKNYYYDYVKS